MGQAGAWGGEPESGDTGGRSSGGAGAGGRGTGGNPLGGAGPSGGEPSGGASPDSGGTSSGGTETGGAASGGAPGSGGISGTGGGAASGGAPSCCGCLCEDALWSCSEDTCVTEEGHAWALGPEAGFLEVRGGDYQSDGVSRSSPTHRIFYTFHPSRLGDEAPLAIFFNGGPGSSTATLMGLNTAPITLDPTITGDAATLPNPLSWDRGMHTLHVDAPATGFSYVLPLEDGRKPTIGIDLDRDAAVFVRVLLDFLERHPTLTCNKVIIVGESYGGTRATLMLQHLLHPERLELESWIYVDPELAEVIRAHELRTASCSSSEEPIPLAQQFDSQILIQPVTMGNVQWSRNAPDRSICLGGSSGAYDNYQCDRPRGYMDGIWDTLAQKLTTFATLQTFLGVDPETIRWFYPEERTLAYGKSPSLGLPPVDLPSVFGLLTSADSYHLDGNADVRSLSPNPNRWWTDPRLAPQFLENLRTVKTLVTNAPFDMVVDTTAMLRGIASMTSTIEEIRSVDDPSAERPGWYLVTYLDDHQIYLRMPTYEAAGHAVTFVRSGELYDDTMAFLENPEPETPAISARTISGAANLEEARRRDSAPVAASPGAELPYLGP